MRCFRTTVGGVRSELRNLWGNELDGAEGLPDDHVWHVCFRWYPMHWEPPASWECVEDGPLDEPTILVARTRHEALNLLRSGAKPVISSNATGDGSGRSPRR